MQPYRAAERPDPYAEAWARLRRRRLVRRLVVGVAGCAFGAALVFGLESAPSPSYSSTMKWPLMAVGGALAMGIGLVAWRFAGHLAPFLCPRCGAPFFRGLMMEIGFTRSCASCGLAVGGR